MEKAKRRHGPVPLPASEKREKRVTVFFQKNEIERLADRAGGQHQIPAFLRSAGLGGGPRRLVVPPLNREAWSKLARAAGNLNQISARLNFASGGGDETAHLAPDVNEITAALADFRRRLLGQDLFHPQELEEVADESEN